MKIIVDSKEAINKLVSSMVKKLVSEKPDACLAFTAGRSLEGVFAELASDETADLSGCEVFNVCEYIGADESLSCAHQLNEELYSKKGITKLHNPPEENPESYDDEITAHGGLDLVVLGIGLNGHIGFNEPATLFDTHTHVQQLTDSTKRMKADHFGGVENVPGMGVTMGLKTICSAKNVILVAFGEEKAEIIHKLVYGKTTTYVPAAMLQMHMNMTLCLDKEAASKLD